jgi:hypothetical protein
MGSSIAMIDYHYGHLAHDSRQHAISLRDALALERAVDAGWTPPGSRQTLSLPGSPASSEAIAAHRGRSVDVDPPTRRLRGE